MSPDYIHLTPDNLANEHLCCAIADKKHQHGVDTKRTWLAQRLPEGHTFRKLNQKGKVFIEYAPLEGAWVPVVGENYMFIYCLWVSGGFKGKGYGTELLGYCIDDAKRQGKSGVCVLSANKKKPFLTEKKFVQRYAFETADTIEEYELMALSFDGSKPRFADNAKKLSIDNQALTIYYGLQCPYIPNCIKEVQAYCSANDIPLELIEINTLEKAKAVPCVFNNWAVFYKGKLMTLHLLNEGYLKRMLSVE